MRSVCVVGGFPRDSAKKKITNQIGQMLKEDKLDKVAKVRVGFETSSRGLVEFQTAQQAQSFIANRKTKTAFEGEPVL